MKSIKIIIAFVLGVIVSGIGVYALSINSKDVSYKTTNVSDAIDDLYEKVTNSVSKFCELKSGNALEVGSMYECDPGEERSGSEDSPLLQLQRALQDKCG